MNRNVRLMSTLKINFEFENMSDVSLDSHDFENTDEFSNINFYNLDDKGEEKIPNNKKTGCNLESEVDLI